ncbi:MAG: hypothetical protein ACLVL7_07215 [Anaerotruncus massiliensis (ex Togo et al. 2019)]
MDTFWGLLIFFGVAVLAAGAALVLYKKLHPRTEDSERRKVSRALRSFAAPRGYKVIDSPVLVSNGLSGWADHILVGYFGVLLVYDLCYAGEYFGGPDEEQWSSRTRASGGAQPAQGGGPVLGRVLTLCRTRGTGCRSSRWRSSPLTARRRSAISNLRRSSRWASCAAT